MIQYFNASVFTEFSDMPSSVEINGNKYEK